MIGLQGIQTEGMSASNEFVRACYNKTGSIGCINKAGANLTPALIPALLLALCFAERLHVIFFPFFTGEFTDVTIFFDPF